MSLIGVLATPGGSGSAELAVRAGWLGDAMRWLSLVSRTGDLKPLAGGTGSDRGVARDSRRRLALL